MPGRKEMPTLAEQGYDALHTEHWDEIDFDDKQDHLQLIDQRLKQFVKPNMQVRIGDRVFQCHSLLLQSYSEMFDELGNEPMVELPAEKVTPEAFGMVYEWMLASKADVRRERFVELFVAAEFLKIGQLVNQCWICMDSSDALVEERAFLLYLEATRFQQSDLQSMLLKRICKFFLPLVASKEFVELPLEDVSILLKSNGIGVFSEADAFYAACFWLLEDWTSRCEYVSDIMNLVRFPLIRPALLAELNSFDADDRLLDILRHDTVRSLVAQALTYAFSSETKSSDMQTPVERIQLEDPEAAASLAEGGSEIFAFRTHKDYRYEAFLRRLDHLAGDRDCWKRWQKLESRTSVLRLSSSSVEREEN